MLLHLVAGAHNDAIMLGLLGVGLVAALGRWPVLGAVLITLAALVKAPAVLGLLAVVVAARAGRRPVRAHGPDHDRGRGSPPRPRRPPSRARATAGSAALNTPVSPHNWSPTSLLGRATGALLKDLGSDLAPLAVPVWHATRAGGDRRWSSCSYGCACGRGPVYALGLSLAAVAVFGPAIRPWYALWGLFLIAAAAPNGSVRHRVAAGQCGARARRAAERRTAGRGQLVLAVCGGALALVVLWQARQARPGRGSAQPPVLERTA